MPFLGRSPGSKFNTNVMLDAITTSATATYALTKDSAAYTPKSVQALLVSLNGVTQAPTAAYTISGSNIVFASALTSNDVIDYIIAFEGDVTSLDVSNISAGDIATSMLADDAVTAAKIADDAVVTAAIADDAITSALIADDAITSALIADDAVGSDQLAGSLTVDINGGTVDGAIIGGSSAAAGTFTTVTASTLKATGDTAAGDDAAIGYTAAEGLILTGQGSTNDVTIKNDADADVLEIPTGTTSVTMTGSLKPLTYQETYVDISTATTMTCDLATGNSFSATAASSTTTFAFSNPPSSGIAFSFTLILTQHSTAVSLAWPSSVDWAGGSAPDAAGNNEVQAYGFLTRDGGTTYYGFLGGTALG